MLNGEASFSRPGSSVTFTGQWADRVSRPVATASLWTSPAGSDAYTYAREGSTIGVAVVICAEPATDRYELGVNSHSCLPVPGSIAIVLPYVVVTKIASRTRPPILTACSSTAEQSTVPSMCTTRVLRRRTLPGLIPVPAGPTPLRWAL